MDGVLGATMGGYVLVELVAAGAIPRLLLTVSGGSNGCLHVLDGFLYGRIWNAAVVLWRSLFWWWNDDRGAQVACGSKKFL